MSGGSSRFRYIGRHYPSGWKKRKTKEDKLKKAELAVSKPQKMMEFFTKQRDDGGTSSSRSKCKETSKNQKLLKKKTPEKETVEVEDASTTIKYLNDLGIYVAKSIERN